MQQASIQLETLACPSCMQKIENGMKALEGVDKESLKVMFNSSKVKVRYDAAKLSIGDIEAAIGRLGYTVIKSQVKDA